MEKQQQASAAKCDSSAFCTKVDDSKAPFRRRGAPLSDVMPNEGHNLPQRSNACPLPVRLPSGWLKQSSSSSGPVDKVSVCVYLRAPSSEHYHENGFKPCANPPRLCCNKCLHSDTPQRGDEDAPVTSAPLLPTRLSVSPCADRNLAQVSQTPARADLMGAKSQEEATLLLVSAPETEGANADK